MAFARIRPSVVHAWLDVPSCAAGLAALAAGVPRVILGGRAMAPHHFPLHHPFMRPAYRALLAREPAQVSMVNNSAAGAASYAAWLDIDVTRVHVVHNIVTARRPKLADASGVDSQVVVGGMMRFTEEKCPLVFVDVAARVLKERPGVRFALYGEGPLGPRVARAVAAAGIAARFALCGATTDAVAALSSFDVVLATSRQEGLPNVVLEAQALGIPVVTTRAGGTTEAVVDAVTALTAAVGDVDALARAVMHLVDDAALRARVGGAGAAFVAARFGVERALSAYLELYRAAG